MIITLSLVLILCSQAFALTGTTKEYGIACISEQYVSDAISFLADKDVQNLQAYIDTGKCVFLKDGIKVNIVKLPMFGNAVFVFNGVKFYCPKSSLSVDTGE